MNEGELHLKVFLTRSELVRADGTIEVFLEGKQSKEAIARYKVVQQALKDGFLSQEIEYCKQNQPTLLFDQLLIEYSSLLDILVARLTSEAGRALIAVTILQLCVKVIAPEQNIRLHKSGRNLKDFSWQDGISMRSLDNTFLTPTLRQYNLLSLNADGFMMTRSLAENYPYTLVYKANMRGARAEWLQIVEGIEQHHFDPRLALRYLLIKLLNQANNIKTLAAETLLAFDTYIAANMNMTFEAAKDLITRHIEESTYAARLMEIAMHSLLTTLEELGVLGSTTVKPLAQMRSANKKHGNIGDIELLQEDKIIEAWDAKYGITYLRDEIDELSEKLERHDAVQLVGFVTNQEPTRMQELAERIADMRDMYNVDVAIMTLPSWYAAQVKRAEDSGIAAHTLGRVWLRMYVMYLANQKRDLAPIDEPTYQWLESLHKMFLAYT